MSRTRIGVLFGGRSTEHEVSVLSARSIISAIDPERFEVIPLYVDRSGRWLVGDSLAELTQSRDSGSYVYLPPDPTQRALVTAVEAARAQPAIPALDVVFPVFHGLNGEAGTIQGVLELANPPYVGSGVRGSALGLDQRYMKRTFAAIGLPVGV